MNSARAAANAADASQLRDRVTAAFGDLYLIGQEIGRGGMAVVYAAEDLKLQRQVALKVLPPDLAFRAEVRERFVREAQTAARLNHPHIVPIYAVHEHSGMVCFAMGLVTGDSVAARLVRESRPPMDFVVKVLEQTADALAYAHACGVVHRDVKPDNILLDRESGRAMVTDFGIARAGESGSRLTQTGVAVGTPAFMSPEQATGDKDVDGRSDLYSLGVVGYLMVAGRLPFEAATTPAMLMKHVSETPPSVFSSRADAPAALVEICERCLAKRPADRWNSALELRDVLRRVQRDGSLQHLGDRGRSSPMFAPPQAPVRDVMTHEYRDKAGHRAEDWAPRGVLEASPAPRQLPAPAAVPPMPLFPPLPRSADREEKREWKAAKRDALEGWRDAVRDQRRESADAWRDRADNGTYPLEAARAGRSDERLIGKFKGQLVWTAGMIVFLGVINVATRSDFPWAIFPAMGMSMGLLGRYRTLRERGITWARIWDDAPGDSLANDASRADAALPKPQRMGRAVRAFRRHLKWLAGSAVAAAASFAIGDGFNLDPMIVPFVGALALGAANQILLVADYFRLRRLGITPLEALSSDWEQLARVADDRPRHLQLNEALARIAGPDVLQSTYGQTVRSAVDDRMTIQDASLRLSDADRALVPDVEPTADKLLERIGALATGLERLERDIPGDAIGQLDARIAASQAEPESAPDHERRLALLTRQRASLQELIDRRGDMQRHLESASMALRSLRLDMIKLRTMGVGAAIGDVTTATQEARALSLDIGRALYAADEVRKL